MAHAQVAHDFSVPIETLWGLIGDFGNMTAWGGPNLKSCVQEGSGIGALRTLTVAMPNGDMVIIDRLEAQTPLSYSYSIVKSALPYVSYLAKMQVSATGDAQCRLTWSSTFEPRGMDEAQSIAFTEGMYRRGIELMERALRARK